MVPVNPVSFFLARYWSPSGLHCWRLPHLEGVFFPSIFTPHWKLHWSIFLSDGFILRCFQDMILRKTAYQPVTIWMESHIQVAVLCLIPVFVCILSWESSMLFYVWVVPLIFKYIQLNVYVLQFVDLFSCSLIFGLFFVVGYYKYSWTL